MAGSKIKGINIKIGADTTGLDTALKNIEKSGKSASSELREIENAMKKSGESAELLKQKYDVLKIAVDSAKDKVKLLPKLKKLG